MPDPLMFKWDGSAFSPIPRHMEKSQERFAAGQHYALEEVMERCSNSHKHYHASVRQAWLNLPENIAHRFATPDHLRKHALLELGYFDQRTLVASSNAEAHRLAAFMRPKDDYAVYIVKGRVVTEFTPKSQSYAAMGRREFQTSKWRVLNYLADMIGTSTKALEGAAVTNAA